jgi:hypothetical protein
MLDLKREGARIVIRVLRGGILYAALGPPIGVIAFWIYAAVAEWQSATSVPPATNDSWLPWFFAFILLSYPEAWVPAFITGTVVGLISYKGARERRSRMAMKAFVIGAIVSFLYFGGWRWPSIWRYLTVDSIPLPMIVAGAVAAAVCALFFYAYADTGKSAGTNRVV